MALFDNEIRIQMQKLHLNIISYRQDTHNQSSNICQNINMTYWHT